MYSKNDYRYYLEHRLEESDDYLAHYGVKGMKWKHHKVPKLGLYELNKMQRADQDAFYAKNSGESEKHLKEYRKAKKAYSKTLLGKADKKTHGLASAPIRVHNQRKRRASEKRHQEYEAWRKAGMPSRKKSKSIFGHNTTIR